MARYEEGLGNRANLNRFVLVMYLEHRYPMQRADHMVWELWWRLMVFAEVEE